MKERSNSYGVETLRRLLRNPLATGGAIFLVLLVLATLFAPWLTSYPYDAIDLPSQFQAPSWKHLFGTDSLGRDVFSRVLYGGRVSLAVGFLTGLVALFIGVTYGAVSGYAGGKTDTLMMRFVDVLYGLPYIFFVILLMVAFGRKFYLLFIGIGAVSWMTIARITRGQVMTIKNHEYVLAARSIGASGGRVLFRHILPNAIGPIVVYVTLTIPGIMLEEAFLSFIGLGVQAPRTSWGILASEGKNAILSYPWILIFPAIMLTLTLFSLNFLGEGLRDALDPTQRE